MIANENAAHTVVRAFRRHGVEVAFGQSIPTAFHLAAPGYGIRQFAYRTENAGAAMADGYARISGRVAVVTAQNGPAATLLVPGLAEALKASIPIVALVQDVARGTTDRNAFQELEHLDLFRGVAKWVRRVAQADRIDDDGAGEIANCTNIPGGDDGLRRNPVIRHQISRHILIQQFNLVPRHQGCGAAWAMIGLQVPLVERRE